MVTSSSWDQTNDLVDAIHKPTMRLLGRLVMVVHYGDCCNIDAIQYHRYYFPYDPLDGVPVWIGTMVPRPWWIHHSRSYDDLSHLVVECWDIPPHPGGIDTMWLNPLYYCYCPRQSYRLGSLPWMTFHVVPVTTVLRSIGK